MHVHVEIPDRERAVLVSNHLRQYLPTLIALSANSPYWAGTGHGLCELAHHGVDPVASGRATTVLHLRRALRRTRRDADRVRQPWSMRAPIFWDIRPSARFPTIEVRAADVPMTAEQSALLAMLIRALVAAAAAQVDRGDPGPVLPAEMLRLAYWRAARDGLSGHGVDVQTGALVPAAELARRLLRGRPADAGRLRRAGARHAAGCGQLIAGGDGASRQRAAAARRGGSPTSLTT